MMKSDSTQILRRIAHAKVNLGLAVDPPDPISGLHPICSWMHPVALGDEITIRRSQSSSYAVRWSDGRAVNWDLGDDLAVRAHQAMEQACGRGLGAELEIKKHIPAGGGLGGGSSDAAMTLLMLNDLYGLGMDEAQLHKIGRGIGSDVLFFLDLEAYEASTPPRPALVTGVGDQIERVDRSAMRVVLVAPAFGCSTAAVYNAFDQTDAQGLDAGMVRKMIELGLEPGSVLGNDLVPAAISVEPRLRGIRDRVQGVLSSPVHISGSGSTLFVLGEVDAQVIGGAAAGCTVIETALI